MLFNSFEFILFFIFVTTSYFILPHKYRWFLLLASSCYFYMAFIPIYILILGATIVIDYFAGIYIEKLNETKTKNYTRWFLIASLIANIGVLAVFKYYNFFIDNFKAITDGFGWQINYCYLGIALPIGLSFHTFQAMSYTIEVYRGNQKAERHFGIYSLYVMFYPQLVAGPIERPQNILHQFHEKKLFNYLNVTNGLKLMAWGLFKKVVIADRLAIFTDPVFNQPQNYPAITLLIAAIFFSYQIYCDFSGYSDIALGSAQVMGFELMKNFDRPYHSKSISEFWKRWHISLSTWFRDYLYIPLGGSRVATLRRLFFNLFFVFLVSGFWHGANWTFIVWGALHGFYLIFALIKDKLIHKFLPRMKIIKPGVLNISIDVIVTFILVMVAWIFFRCKNLADSWLFIKKMFSEIVGDIYIIIVYKNINLNLTAISKTQIILSIFLILALETIHIIQGKESMRLMISSKPIIVRWSLYYGIVLAIIFLGVFDKREFIYFQF
jgi:alginate O-acetyltransferase complex protein AlgI